VRATRLRLQWHDDAASFLDRERARPRLNALIVGGGIGGLTLALTLQRAGIACRVFEMTPEMRALGVGINVLPHASKVYAELGLDSALEKVSVLTREAVFSNRFGQLIYREALGRDAGYPHAQYSIHRGELQRVLLEAVVERIGPGAVSMGWKCVDIEQDETGAVAHFQHAVTGDRLPAQRAEIVVGCDGLHSAVRKLLHPHEGRPLYSGINMWRGVTVAPPILSGASMIRAGWLATGKLVVYPIRDNVDGQGRQLINWVAELETPRHANRDWNRQGDIADFIHAFEDWHFDWMDAPALIRGTESILEFPMVDQDPLPWWSQGRVTLLGDAAHPMYPRGSNGAGQAILDAQRSPKPCVANATPSPR
jgi:2-polyprenyl-6-methoxyphenol hydroxylase-like FAD-dependent oxidoreductase